MVKILQEIFKKKYLKMFENIVKIMRLEKN